VRQTAHQLGLIEHEQALVLTSRQPTSSNFAQAFHASQLFLNCALASSRVATLSERVIGPLAVMDQNQRSLSGRRESDKCARSPTRR